MKGLFGFAVLVLIAIVGFGFYRGWFELASENSGNKSNVTFSVDQAKIHDDENKAREKVQELGKRVKDETIKVKDEAKEKAHEVKDKAKAKTGDADGKDGNP